MSEANLKPTQEQKIDTIPRSRTGRHRKQGVIGSCCSTLGALPDVNWRFALDAVGGDTAHSAAVSQRKELDASDDPWSAKNA